MKFFVFFLVLCASDQFVTGGRSVNDGPVSDGCEVSETALAELAELRRIVGQLTTLVETLIGGPPEPGPCEGIICDVPVCEDGFVVAQEPVPGECCFGCVDPCAGIICDIPVCEDGFVVAKEPVPGECCVGCVDPCEGILCDVPVCEEGFVVAQEPAPGDCCVGCVDPCEGILCDVPIFEDGFVVAQEPVPGECCVGCVDPCDGIICDIPVCEDGFVVAKEPAPGDCCVGCVDPCEGIFCVVPICEDGFVVAQEPVPGECCVGCVDPCEGIICDVPICEAGFVVAQEPVPGECCVGCVDPCEGIICDIPICSDGFVLAQEPAPGKCCVGCVDPCEGVFCDVPVCEEGLVVAQRPAIGECCVGCIDPCELIACDEPICIDDYVLSPPAEGECCAGCVRQVFEDCSDAQASGMTFNKAYLIQPAGVAEPFEVQCDFVHAGGRWTVILRRIDSPENFLRDYDEYVAGFGDANDAYFVGLENLYRLNKQGNTRMAIRGIDHLGEAANGHYNIFRMANATDNYTLDTIVGFKGSIGNALGYNKGAPFSAPGRDMDNGPRDCATVLGGGWWHKGKICTRANPLGEFLTPDEFALEKGIFWAPFKGKGKSLQYLELKIRPV